MYRWSKRYKISIYNRKKDLIDDKILLSDDKGSNLSPYTNFILNTSLKLLKKGKNLIIVSPKPSFKPIPLLGYLLADFFNCDVEITTNKYNFKNYIKTYCLLADDKKQGCYIFTLAPPLFKEEDYFKLYLYIPRAKKDQKQKLKESTIKNIHNINKILFVDNVMLLGGSNKILIENKEILKINLKPKIFLIENGLYYLKYYRHFIEFFTSINTRNANFIMFVNSLLNERINNLAKKTNSEVLYFSPSLFYETKDIVYYKEYIKKLKEKKVYITKTGWEMLNKLNFDEEWDYHKPEIEVIRIQGYHELSRCFRDIRKYTYIIRKYAHTPNTRRLTNYIENITIKLIESFLPPDTIKEFDIDEGRVLTPLDFVKERVAHCLEETGDSLDIYIKKLYKNFVIIYRSLNEVRRPHKGENLKNSKYMALLELLERKEPKTKYYILTLHDSKDRLKENIKYFLKERKLDTRNIEICGLNNLVKTNYNINSNSILILPTSLDSDKFSYYFLLQLPFKKILILLYEGLEKDSYGNIKQIEVRELKQSIDSICKIHKVIRTKPPKIFKDVLGKTIKDHGLSKYIKEIAEIKEQVKKATKDSMHETSLPEIDKAERDLKMYKLVLKAKASGEIKEVTCVYYKPILKLNMSSMVLEEPTVSMLKEGDIICLIDDDERKHIVDLISEIFIDDGDVNINLIKYWHIKLKKYIIDNKISISDFYYKYKSVKTDNIKDYQTVRLWIHGEVLGPRDLGDLKVLAEIIEDDFLKENYEKIHEEIEKVRKVHRMVGRKINKVVRGLLTSDLSGVASFDEKVLLDKLKLYKVIKIEEISKKI